jgi:methionyl-tRNA formyltransferase
MMQFAITATDPYLCVFETFVNAGWRPVKLFTTLHHNKAVVEYAQRLGLDVQFSRMNENDLKDLALRGCEALVVASYDWRIGDWRPYLKYAVNFHPSPLPEGRGPYPQVQAILENRPAWGVTCHKVAPEFDAGDILDQELFPLYAQECHESINLRVQMAGRTLAERVAHNFARLWHSAQAQGEGSYFRLWNNEDRTLNFNAGVHDILRRVRAFGLIETMATVNEKTFYVRRAIGWVEPHAHLPGALVHRDQLMLVVAALDGYIGIIEWSLFDKDTVVGRIGR